MAEMMLVIGGDTCLLEDKLPGKVKSVVIDRDARKVTYLVVEPKGRVGLARFVPVDDVHVTVHPHHLWGHHADTLRLPYKEDGFKKLARRRSCSWRTSCPATTRGRSTRLTGEAETTSRPGTCKPWTAASSPRSAG